MSDNQLFDFWLVQKKILPQDFQLALPDVYNQWRLDFQELGEASFFQRYRFKLNQIRRIVQGLESSRPTVYDQSVS